jgi:phosphohistidine swiveling domain-containing protein
MLLPKIEYRVWSQINYRRTSSLLAAEFLHGLYQRHNPFLNPIRFCNTLIFFSPWYATSYAPATEWDLLATRFGGRFLRNPQRVGQELEQVLAHPRTRSRSLSQELASLDLSCLGDLEIMDLLLETHHVPLGEIYEVNLVQVEHALHCAIRQRLHEVLSGDTTISDDHVNRILANLCHTDEPTIAGNEEQRFLEFVLRCRNQAVINPDDVAETLGEFVRLHSKLGSAYGAQTITIEGMKHRFREYIRLPQTELVSRLNQLQTAANRQLNVDLSQEKTLNYLVRLLRRTGEVRDKNKQLLGEITRYRTALLEQIALRRDVKLEHIRLHLLEELMRLLEDGLEIPVPILEQRYRRGVVFSRNEHIDWPENLPSVTALELSRSSDELNGLCASPGTYEGKVRIVRSAGDLDRMHIGDVLVAEGTDFDLVLLLQMAGAIITEEGGLLSHASVLARELGIPCIIGVPKATELLKDGTSVLVDADAGVVRPIIPEQAVSSSLMSLSTPEIALGLVSLESALDPKIVGRKATSLAQLSRHGFPVPSDLTVIPIPLCNRICEEMVHSHMQTLEHLAITLAERYAGININLRSSSLHEDQRDRSAAGIYFSAICVASEMQAIKAALIQVLASASGAAAAAYHSYAYPKIGADLAIIVGPYKEVQYQGSALSQSPWAQSYILIDAYESRGKGGCPDRGGSAFHIRRDFDQAGRHPTVEHFANDLLQIAHLTLKVEQLLEHTVEIEWGMSNRKPVLFQARPIVNISPHYDDKP